MEVIFSINAKPYQSEYRMVRGRTKKLNDHIDKIMTSRYHQGNKRHDDIDVFCNFIISYSCDLCVFIYIIAQFNLENRWRKRGIAIVPMKYPVGYFGTLHALVSIYHTDGTVAITHGGIEMGQGINTRAAQVAAKVLGIPVEKIAIKPTTNLTAPNDFCTQASITSEAVAHVRS